MVQIEQKKLHKYKSILKNIPRTLKLVWGASPMLLVITILITGVSGLLPFLAATLDKILLDIVVNLVNIKYPISRILLTSLPILLILYLSLNIFSEIVGHLEQLMDRILGNRVIYRVNTLIYEKGKNLKLSFFERPDFKSKYLKVKNQSNYRPMNVVRSLLITFRVLVTLLSFLFVAVSFSPWLVLIFLFLAFPRLWQSLVSAESIYSVYDDQIEESKEMYQIDSILFHDNYAKETKAFSLHNFFIDWFNRNVNLFYQENRKIWFRNVYVSSLLDLVDAIAYLSAYIIVILRGISGVITIGTMFLVLRAFRSVQGDFSKLFERMGDFYESNLYLDDLYEYLDLSKENYEQVGNQKVELSKMEVVFENVSFKYSEELPFVLKNVNLKIKQGDNIALVGENGAGKSTFIKILAGLYTPTEGRVLINGVDLKEISLEDYRYNIGIIFQDFVYYSFSARIGIGVGRIEKVNDNEAIIAAAKRAGIHDDIEKLSKGYETPLSRYFDEGVGLSWGQYQKVALARAFLRDAPLMIFDEPTASLSPESEYEVIQKFKEELKENTLVIVSHRFGNVRFADKIYVFDKGEIIEFGTHEELVTSGGMYSHLFNLQAQGYK